MIQHTQNKKFEKASAVRTIRNTIGMSQAQFARMIGASLDTVISWENNRNALSHAFEQRILLATGAEILPDSPVQTHWRAGSNSGFAGKPYCVAAFNFWRAHVARGDKETAESYTKRGADALSVLLRASALYCNGRKDKLPALWQSFEEWLVQATEDFDLGPQIKELQSKGPQPTFYWRHWRKPPGHARTTHSKDSPAKARPAKPAAKPAKHKPARR